MKTPIALASLLLSTALLAGCGTEEDGAPAPSGGGVIDILEPAAGAAFKLTDTVRVVTRSDYTKFTSGITFNYSTDSAKTWKFIESKVRKEGIDKDTLLWVPADGAGEVAAGQRVLIQVYDYSKAYVKQSGYIAITN